LQAVGIGHVGTDRNRFVSSEVSGFLAGLGIDLTNRDFRALAGELRLRGRSPYRRL
jgi:hypothetical protein